MKNFLTPCQDYIDVEKNVNKTDAYLVSYILIGLGYSFWRSGWLVAKAGINVSLLQMMPFTGISSTLTILLIVIFCKLRGQPISSIGLNTKYAKQSLLAGILLSLVYVILFTVSYKGASRNDIVINIVFILRILYELLFVALFEEIVIRAYIGTRLRALFKNKLLSVFITGFLWAILHVPAYLASTQLGVFEYITKGLWPFGTYILLHFVLNTLYSKYNNIIGGTLLHATINILPWLFAIQ